MPRLLAFFETDCPTCRLMVPYLNTLAKDAIPVAGISQDGEAATREFVEQMSVTFPVQRDPDFAASKKFNLVTVPTLFLLDDDGRVLRKEEGFDKNGLNAIAEALGHAPVASPYDGAPASKPGCMSRHLETATEGESP